MTVTDFAKEQAVQAGSPPRATWRFIGLRRAILCVGLVLAALLALPGATVTTKYVNDLFIYLDGAHRIWSGQVPNVDFHSSLGPLAFYLPAAGYGLTGSMAAAMPVGMALVVVLFAIVIAEIIGSRMQWTIGLPLAAFLLLIAAAPANPGEWLGELTFAMFYNRLGWATLGLLLVMYLPRTRQSPRTEMKDAACATFLVLLMLYTKITYGLVNVAFLLFLLSDRRQYRWAILSLGLCIAIVLLIEAIWQGGLDHLADLRLANQVSGGVPSARILTDIALRNLADVTIYAIFAVLLLLSRRRLRDLLFIGFCVATGFLIIDQNFQTLGILTLGASAAVIAELLLRSEIAPKFRRLSRGLPMLLAALLLPATVSNAASLTIHFLYALSGKGEQVPLPNFEGIRLVPMWSTGQYDYFRRYNETLADGAAALADLGEQPAHVVVLDFVNPFSAGMPLPPPAGDSAWYHWGRTLNRDHHPPAEEIFADAALVLDPKSPIEIWTAAGMRDIYADYIADHYELVTETDYWRIYRRRS